MILQEYEEIIYGNDQNLIQLINYYIRHGNEMTASMVGILDVIDRCVKPVTLMDDGQYALPEVMYNYKTNEQTYKPVKGGTPWRDIPKTK